MSLALSAISSARSCTAFHRTLLPAAMKRIDGSNLSFLCITGRIDAKRFSLQTQLRSPLLPNINNLICPTLYGSSTMLEPSSRNYSSTKAQLISWNPGIRRDPVISGGIGNTAFTWSEIKEGNCHQIDGLLTLRSDGTAHFSCTLWTDKTRFGDAWRTNFSLNYPGGRWELMPWHQGPRMNDGCPSPRYDWEFDFTFPSSIYEGITKVSQNCGCYKMY